MARPADWLEPIDRPAITAAHQKPPLVVTEAAITQTAIHATSVMANANRWPMRSCR